jgi:glutamine synthetase
VKPEVDALYQEFGLVPLMAAEIECYVMLADESPYAIEMFFEPVEKAFHQHGLSILRIEQEHGHNQFEIITHVMTPAALVQTLQQVRSIIEKYAVRNNVQATFAGKPFIDQPSSGMHLHLHLADAEGINSYHKTEEWTSDTLRYSLGGLLDVMAQQMPIYFPDITDYARLNDVDHVPKIFGWGVNNRYCALRIPADPDMYNKRIEHRVPCANADPALVVEAMLAGVLHGLRERIEPPEQQYGKWGESAFHQLAFAPVSEAAHVATELLDIGM